MVMPLAWRYFQPILVPINFPSQVVQCLTEHNSSIYSYHVTCRWQLMKAGLYWVILYIINIWHFCSQTYGCYMWVAAVNKVLLYQVWLCIMALISCIFIYIVRNILLVNIINCTVVVMYVYNLLYLNLCLLWITGLMNQTFKVNYNS